MSETNFDTVLASVLSRGNNTLQSVTGENIETIRARKLAQYENKKQRERVPTVAEISAQYHNPNNKNVGLIKPTELQTGTGSVGGNDTLTSLQIGANSLIDAGVNFAVNTAHDTLLEGKPFPEFNVSGHDVPNPMNTMSTTTSNLIKFFAQKVSPESLDTMQNSDSVYNRELGRVLSGESKAFDKNVLAKTVDEALGQTARREGLFNQYTDETKQDFEEVERKLNQIDTGSWLGDFGESVKAIASNPNYMYQTGVQSVPSLAVGMASKSPVAVASILEALSGADSVRQQAMAQGLDLNSPEVQNAMRNTALGNAVITAGFSKLAPADLDNGLGILGKHSVGQRVVGTAMEGGEELLIATNEKANTNAMTGNPVGKGTAQAGATGFMGGVTLSGAINTAGISANAIGLGVTATVDKAKSALAPSHEQRINPDHEKYNPQQAFVNAHTAYQNADNDEARATAKQQMNEAINSVQDKLAQFDEQINSATDKTQLEELEAQRKTFEQKNLQPLLNVINGLDNLKNVDEQGNTVGIADRILSHTNTLPSAVLPSITAQHTFDELPSTSTKLNADYTKTRELLKDKKGEFTVKVSDDETLKLLESYYGKDGDKEFIADFLTYGLKSGSLKQTDYDGFIKGNSLEAGVDLSIAKAIIHASRNEVSITPNQTNTNSTIKSHNFTDQRVSKVSDINHKFRMPFHNVSKSGGNSLFSGGVVKADTLGFMQLLDGNDDIVNASVGFTSITGGKHTKVSGHSHGHGFKIDLDLKGGDDVETYARVGQMVADLAKQHGYIVQVNAEKDGWGKIGKRGDVNFINGGGSHLDITVVGRTNGIGSVVSTPKPMTSTQTNQSFDLANATIKQLPNGKWTSDNPIIARIIAVESGGKADIRRINSNGKPSKYRGLFQIDSNNKVDYNATNYDDPHENFKLANAVLMKNSDALKKRGIPVNAHHLYLTHNQGLHGFTQIYKVATGQLPESALGSGKGSIRYNMDNNGGKGKSAKEFITYWGKRIERNYVDVAKANGFAPVGIEGNYNNSSPINNSEQAMNHSTHSPTQDELSSRALRLIQELESADEDNKEQIKALQEELTSVQEQLANPNQPTEEVNQQKQEQQEQPLSRLDEQVIADIRAKELNRIRRSFSQLIPENEEEYQQTLNQLDKLEQTGILNQAEATGYRLLLAEKMRIKGENADSVSNHIYNGIKGQTTLESNLGLKDYNNRLVMGLSTGNTQTTWEHLTRFRNDHVSKANAIREALDLYEGKPITIAFSNQANKWQITDEPLPLPSNVRKYTITTSTPNSNMKQIMQEAKDIDAFTNAWEGILFGSNKAIPTVPTTTREPITAVPQTNEVIESKPTTTPKPIASNHVEYSNVAYAPDVNSMNDENGVWIGRVSDGKETKSMSYVAKATGAFDGMFANPFNINPEKRKQNPRNTYFVNNEQELREEYRGLLARHYTNTKKTWFRGVFESLRGKILYSGAGSNAVEAKLLNELLDETANMTDDEKMKFMGSLGEKSATTARVRKAMTQQGRADEWNATKPVEQSNEGKKEQEQETVTTSNETREVEEYVSDYNEETQLSEEDLTSFYEMLDGASTPSKDEVKQEPEKEIKQEIKQEQSKQELIDKGIIVKPTKLTQGIDEIKSGKHSLIDVVHLIGFDDDGKVIVNGILKKYPDITISFDKSDADIKTNINKPKDIVQSLVSLSTHQLLDFINKDTDDKELITLKRELDLIQSRLKQLSNLPVKEARIVEMLLQDYESLIGYGLKNKEFLSKIETNNSKIKSNIFTMLMNGIKSFFGIPHKENISNLYERLLDVTAKAIEIQAKDNTVNGKLSMLAKNKEERESESKLAYNQMNVLKAGINQQGNANLIHIKDLTSRIKRHGLAELSRLGLDKPTYKQQEQLEHFLAFEVEFKKALELAFRSKHDGYRYQDLKQFLNIGTTDNPVFDDNLITALAHVAYDYAVVNGGSNQLDKRELRKVLQADNDTVIPYEIAKKYRYMGLSINEVTASLGGSVIRDLGLTQTDIVPHDTLAKLEASIGDWLLASMQIADMVDINTMPSSEYQADIAKVNGIRENEVENKSNDMGVTYFVMVSDNSINTDIGNVSKGTGNYLANVLGTKSNRLYPHLKPIKYVQDKVERTKGLVTKKQTERISKAQQEPIVLNQDMLKVMDSFMGQDEIWFLNLLGARELTDEELNTIHKSKRESKQESALGNRRDLRNLQSFREFLPKPDTPFYDTIKVAKNGRMHYVANMFNFQSSTIHRAFGEYANFKKEIDLSKGVVLFDNKGKPTIINHFLKAIFENAEGTEKIFESQLKELGYPQGFTVDKVPSQDFLPIALNYLQTDPLVKSAIDAMNAMNNKETLNQSQKKAISNLVNKWDMGANSLRALMEVTNFMNALKNKTKFTTSLGLGSDGINNGTAIGSILMGIWDTKLYNQIGLYEKASEYNNYGETRKIKEIGDYYTGLEPVLIDAIETLKLDEELVEIKSIFEKLNTNLKKRKMLKAILIPFGYGAGNARLIQSATEQMIADIYARMEDIINKPEFKDSQETHRLALQKELQVILGGKFTLPENLLEFTFNDSQLKILHDSYKATLGKAIEKAMDTYASEFSVLRTLNINLHEMNFTAYNMLRERLEREAEEYRVNKIKEQYPDVKENELNRILAYQQLTNQERKELIEDKLLEVFPTLSNSYEYDEDTGNSIELVESRKTFTKDKFADTATHIYDGKTKSLVNRSKKVLIRAKQIVSTGVTANSQMIQSTDSANSSLAMVANNIVSINVHDANIGNLEHYTDMAIAQNKAFFENTAKYHIYTQSIESLINTLEHLDDFTKEEQEELVTEWLGILNGNELFKKEITIKNLGGKEVADNVEDIISTLVRLGLNQDIKKLENLAQLKSIHQYGGEFGEYVLTKADYQMIDDELVKLKEIHKKLDTFAIISVMHYKGQIGAIKNVHYGKTNGDKLTKKQYDASNISVDDVKADIDLHRAMYHALIGLGKKFVDFDSKKLDQIKSVADWVIKNKPITKVDKSNRVLEAMEITNHTGGAYGADTVWDLVGREFGVHNHNHYRAFDNQRPSKRLRYNKVKPIILNKEQMDFARDKVNTLLGLNLNDNVYDNLKVRNYYQVSNADSVVAIAKIAGNFADVTGGTSVAVQLGIAMGKPVHVWNVKTQSWYSFNHETHVFDESDVPMLTANFAGVGTRDIEQYEGGKNYIGDAIALMAEQAIREVYAKSLGVGLAKQTTEKQQKPKVKSKRTNKDQLELFGVAETETQSTLKSQAKSILDRFGGDKQSEKLFNYLVKLNPNLVVRVVDGNTSDEVVKGTKINDGGVYYPDINEIWVDFDNPNWYASPLELINHELIHSVTYAVLLTGKYRDRVLDLQERVGNVLLNMQVEEVITERIMYGALNIDELLTVTLAENQVQSVLPDDTIKELKQLLVDISGDFNEQARPNNPKSRENALDSKNLLPNKGTGQVPTGQPIRIDGGSQPSNHNEGNAQNYGSNHDKNQKSLQGVKEYSLNALKQSLDNLNSTKFNKLTEYIYTAMEKYNPNVRIVMSDEVDNSTGNPSPAWYEHDSNTITISRPVFDSLSAEQKVMFVNHELIHALTEHSLHNPKFTAHIEKLQAMRDELYGVWQDNLSSYSDTMNKRLEVMLDAPLGEFIAYGLTDPDMARWINDNLNAKSKTTAKRSWGDYIKHFLKEVYDAWFGNKSSHSFSEFVKVSQHLMSEYKPINVKVERRNAQIIDEVNNTPLTEIFINMNKGSISHEHNLRLDNLINTFIGSLYGSTNNKALVNLSQGKLKNTSLLSGLKSSDKEAYVTEALVSVFETLINDHSGKLVVNGLDKLYIQAQAQFKTAKDLFPEYDTLSKEEQARLRAIHQKAFNPNNKSLAWFMAVAVSNEQMSKALSNVKPVKQIKESNSWFDKLMGALEEIINYLNGVFFKAKGKDIQAVLDAYVTALAEVETKARNGQVDYIQKGYEYGIVRLKKLADKPVRKAITKYAHKMADNSKLPMPIRATANVLFASNFVEYAEKKSGEDIKSFLLSEQGDRYSFIKESINEVIGLGKRGINIDALTRSNQRIAQTRQVIKDNTIKVVKGLFTKELSQEQSKTITDVILHTELASLLNHGFKAKEVIGLLDKTKRNKVIDDYENKLIQLVGKEMAYDMIHQTHSLAYYLATGNTSIGLLKSAEAIAMGLGSPLVNQNNSMNPEVYKIVDVLASLHSLHFVKDNALNTMNKLIKIEFKGLVGVLNLHQELIKQGKDEFETNPYNYQKGYVPEIVNPHRKVMQVSREQVDKYLRKGFVEVAELKQDDTDDTDGRVLMIHTDYQSGKYVSGALDMVDTHHRGTPIYEQGIHDKDIARVIKEHQRIRKAKLNIKPDINHFDTSGGALVATFDSEGAVMDYHYEMSHSTRDGLLERNNDFAELMGTLAGKLSFKPEMSKHQREVAKIIASDSKAHASKNANEYIWLDFDSKDPEVKRVIRMIPYAFRQELKKQFGAEYKSYPIHKSIYTATFGYQAYSITTIWDKLDNEAKLNWTEKSLQKVFEFWFKENGRKRALQAETVIQELMTVIKDMIVVRSGGVLIGNILSNTYLLMTVGINPIRILKDSTFAWRNVKNYRKNANRIAQLDTLILASKNNQEISQYKRERKTLMESNERNPLKDYMNAGLMSTIVEDLSLSEDTQYKSELQKMVDKYTAFIPKPIQNGFNELSVGQGSYLHNLLSEATQFSDFSAKYTLAKYHQDKGMGFEKSIYEAQMAFINYDIPTNPVLDYLNRVGLTLFTKFFLRFQKMLTRLAYNAPVTSLLGHYGVELMGGQGLYDPLWLNRLGNPLDGSVFLAPSAMGDIITNVF